MISLTISIVALSFSIAVAVYSEVTYRRTRRTMQHLKDAHNGISETLSFMMAEMENRERPDGGPDWIPADYPVFGHPPEGGGDD